jgi:hypothetical protein
VIRRRLGVTLVALALALAVTSAVASAGASAADDQRLARTGVLQRSDFPTGWTQSSRGTGTDGEVDAQAAKLTGCQPFVAYARANRKVPRALSPNFDLGQSTVTNTVSVYPSTARATAAITTFRDPRMPACLKRLFTAVFKAQLSKNKKTAKQLKSVITDIALESGVRLGDDAVVYQGTVDVGLKNGTVETIGLGFVTVRVGTALSGYSYTTDTDISAALQPAIVASITRLQRATPKA